MLRFRIYRYVGLRSTISNHPGYLDDIHYLLSKESYRNIAAPLVSIYRMTSSLSSSSHTVPFYVLQLDCAQPPPTTVTNDDTSHPNDVDMTGSSLHRTKALFTVPENLASELIIHPILCCGSLFYLSVDEVDVSISIPPSTATSNSKQQPSNINVNDNKSKSATATTKTTFISTSYDSTDPDRTAYEIAKRITIRLQNVRNTILAQSQRQTNHNVNKTGEMIANHQTNWAAQMLF